MISINSIEAFIIYQLSVKSQTFTVNHQTSSVLVTGDVNNARPVDWLYRNMPEIPQCNFIDIQTRERAASSEIALTGSRWNESRPTTLPIRLDLPIIGLHAGAILLRP